MDIGCIRWDERGLVPVIARDARTGDVLMLAYMNGESLDKTIKTGYATYYSRSRARLWKKGETSGHTQRVMSISADCDGDALLIDVEQEGPACHTGEMSCFHNTIYGGPLGRTDGSRILRDIYATIASRSANPVEGSYTNYLLESGVEKICKKIGEEASETIIAAVKGAPGEVAYEAADLIYHLLVLLFQQGLTPGDVFARLEERRRVPVKS